MGRVGISLDDKEGVGSNSPLKLDHTINYTISVAAINCAGTGGSVFLKDLDIIAKGRIVIQSVLIICST